MRGEREEGRERGGGRERRGKRGEGREQRSERRQGTSCCLERWLPILAVCREVQTWFSKSSASSRCCWPWRPSAFSCSLAPASSGSRSAS
jgi:hypothetical protein